MTARLTQAHKEHTCILCERRIKFAEMYAREDLHTYHRACFELVAGVRLTMAPRAQDAAP